MTEVRVMAEVRTLDQADLAAWAVLAALPPLIRYQADG
jgi:hypothetical protein